MRRSVYNIFWIYKCVLKYNLNIRIEGNRIVEDVSGGMFMEI